MIIETSANQFYSVRESVDASLSHVWIGFPVKRVKGGDFVFTAKALRLAERGAFDLVRKAGCRIVEAA